MTTCDVAVVGAGPAGLAAATLCAAHGLAVALYDEQSAPGGQIYRGITASPLPAPEVLGDDYWHGATLLRPFELSGARYTPNANVWSLDRHDDGELTLGISIATPGAHDSIAVTARAVVLATGAHERPFPIPGWTLPGVLTVGGAQILLKTAGVVPRGRTVMVGCGPLLWLVAWQYLRAGVAIDAILDTTPRGRLARALRYAPGFVASPYFAKGRALLREVRRSVRVVEFVNSLAIEGAERVGAVRYATDAGTQALPADQVLLHQGVVPDIALADAAGCALTWNPVHACFAPAVDTWGGTSVPGIYVAGDGGGIAGALAAEAHGRVTALAVVNALGRIDGSSRDRAAPPHRRALALATRGRAFLDVLYRPADQFRAPVGTTLACRCEEVTAATIADLARSGCPGPNQMKAYVRCGMGPCQGRWCGLTVTEIIAREQQRNPADVGHYRQRIPVKPLPLGELAAMPVTVEAERAVARMPD